MNSRLVVAPPTMIAALVLLCFGPFSIARAQGDARVHRPSQDARFPSLHIKPQPQHSIGATENSDAPSIAAQSNESNKKSKMTAPMVTVCSSLAVVLGLFAAMVWITRKYSNRSIGGGPLPSEVVQSLGSMAIDPRTRITMLRVGNRILVLSQTATSISPLSEITDLEEVRHLTATCTGDSMQEFASTLEELGREPAQGFTGTPTEPRPQRRRSSLFATA